MENKESGLMNMKTFREFVSQAMDIMVDVRKSETGYLHTIAKYTEVTREEGIPKSIIEGVGEMWSLSRHVVDWEEFKTSLLRKQEKEVYSLTEKGRIPVSVRCMRLESNVKYLAESLVSVLKNNNWKVSPKAFDIDFDHPEHRAHQKFGHLAWEIKENLKKIYSKEG